MAAMLRQAPIVGEEGCVRFSDDAAHATLPAQGFCLGGGFSFLLDFQSDVMEEQTVFGAREDGTSIAPSPEGSASSSATSFSATALSWVQNAYLLTFGGLLLLGARAGDVTGRRRMLIIGLGLFTLASIAVGFSQTSDCAERVSSERSISSECPEPGTATRVPLAKGTRTASHWPPSPFMGKNPPLAQAVVTPWRQCGQVPSLNANGAITRSPFATLRASLPVSSTTPMNSWPIGPGSNGESPR